MQKKADEVYKSVIGTMNQIYSEADNKKEIDYWNGFSQIITESQRLRYENSISQSELAVMMDTKQSVISRFENMGRLPSYDFFARLALAFDKTPGMTLFGDYMGVVPLESQKIIDKKAAERNMSTSDFVQNLLEKAVEDLLIDNNETEMDRIDRYSCAKMQTS